VTIQAGEAIARLTCGNLVEDGPDRFSAGAWTGDYADGRADKAEVMAGSAGRAVTDGFVFSAPSHTLEWIHFVRHDNCLSVSNSLPFLLAKIEDGPDLTYADYYFDVLETYRAGLSKPGRALPTARGRSIEPVVASNLHVGFDLSTSLRRKSVAVAPQNFEDYLAFLQRSTKQLVKNSQSNARRHSFAPIVTVSRGYDSVAAATLAKQAGCVKALTFKDRAETAAVDSDNGKPVAKALGMAVEEYDRQSAYTIEKADDWEFCINPMTGTDKNFMMFSEEIEGRLFITGRQGDTTWSFGRGSGQPMLQEPNAILLSGITLTEPALRLGFIHFPVPTCGAIHAPVLAEIGRSDEMKPWSLGGKYDRPIPRRIAEEAGVARSLFGMKKHGGPGIPRKARLSAKGWIHLQNFFTEVKPCMPSADPLSGWIPRRIRKKLNGIVLWLLTGTPWQKRLAALFGNRFHVKWRSDQAYSIHWAWIKTSERYKTALNANKSHV
jgi:hypothetical protein